MSEELTKRAWDGVQKSVEILESSSSTEFPGYVPRAGDKVQCRNGITINNGQPWTVKSVNVDERTVVVSPGGVGLPLVWEASFDKFNDTFFAHITTR